MPGPPSPPSPPDPVEAQLLRVIRFSIALSVGLMTGFFWAIEQVNPELRFHLGPAACLAGATGTLVSWFVWGHLASRPGAVSPLFRAFALVLTLLTIGAFVYGAKDISRSVSRDFIEGTALALLVLAVLGLLFYRVVQFLEKDAASHHDDP